jgi:hypothetical protein
MSGKNAIYNPSTAHADAHAIGLGAIDRQIIAIASAMLQKKQKNKKTKNKTTNQKSSLPHHHKKRQALREV